MSSALVPIVSVWLAALADPSGGGLSHPAPEPHRSDPQAIQLATEPPVSEVRVGDIAPDFSYQAGDGSWRSLHDLTRGGHVLLVFAPRERELHAIERDRER